MVIVTAPAPAISGTSTAVEELMGPIVTTGCVSTWKLATPSTCSTNLEPAVACSCAGIRGACGLGDCAGCGTGSVSCGSTGAGPIAANASGPDRISCKESQISLSCLIAGAIHLALGQSGS